MAIAYFPKIYEDELMYSTLARFYVHSGYISVESFTKELLTTKNTKISREFVKNLKPEVVDILTRNIELDDLIEHHTMLPMYGRFVNQDKRDIAYDSLEIMTGDMAKILSTPKLKDGEARYFRYCPICAMKDRETHGETYWHRKHQIRGFNICPEHHCFLIDSEISLETKVEYTYAVAAEQVVPEDSELLRIIMLCENVLEIAFTEYAAQVFELPVIRKTPVSINHFLHHKLIGTPYLAPRGKNISYKKLASEMREYYSNTSLMHNLADGHIQRLFGGNRNVFFEVCLLAFFLGISTDELVKMNAPVETPEQIFDEKVMNLLNTGMYIKDIATEMGVAPSVIRMVRDKSIQGEKSTVKQYCCNSKVIDWNKLDKEYLPKVKIVIQELQGDECNLPRKISLYAISKTLKISSPRLKKMPKCMKLINNSTENKEQYWNRKVVWAVRQLHYSGDMVDWRHIRKLTNLKKEQYKVCVNEE